jgi:hypothetical protein
VRCQGLDPEPARIERLRAGQASAERDVHDFLIEKIFPRQAHVITIGELPAALFDPVVCGSTL